MHQLVAADVASSLGCGVIDACPALRAAGVPADDALPAHSWPSLAPHTLTQYLNTACLHQS
jgi:hypothetical protein